ncbi:MAG: glycosyltransferase [Microgenomates group bacterium]
MKNKNLPLVSVVITTKNEEKNIGNCLESIKAQSYPSQKIEIIVVDNNSEDKTKEVAKKYTLKVYNYPSESDVKKKKIINFRGAQLNFGVKKSRGEIIFFPDADMTFDKKLIEEIVELIREKKFDALFIPERVIGRGIFGKIRDFERSFYNQTCIDAVRAIKKSIFLKVGGFDEKNIAFGFDDWDFNKKIKSLEAKITITKNKIYHHEENLTLKKYLSKKRKYAITAKNYIKKWGEKDLDIRKQFGFWYRYFGVFMENGKWKNLIKHPILALGMWFLRGLVGGSYYFIKIFKKNG